MRKQHHQSQTNNDSALGNIFAVIGVIAALAAGGQYDMGAGSIIVLAILFGVAGFAVGRWIEIAIIRLLFIITVIIMFLMNMAIRRFIWELLSAVFR